MVAWLWNTCGPMRSLRRRRRRQVIANGRRIGVDEDGRPTSTELRFQGFDLGREFGGGEQLGSLGNDG
jgi:hypothetical protein